MPLLRFAPVALCAWGVEAALHMFDNIVVRVVLPLVALTSTTVAALWRYRRCLKASGATLIRIFPGSDDPPDPLIFVADRASLAMARATMNRIRDEARVT